jgi:hypothetical protein
MSTLPKVTLQRVKSIYSLGPSRRPGLNTPHALTMVITLKLAIYLFLECWLQIWFQKYYISSSGNQILINKHKNRGRAWYEPGGCPVKSHLECTNQCRISSRFSTSPYQARPRIGWYATIVVSCPHYSATVVTHHIPPLLV